MIDCQRHEVRRHLQKHVGGAQSAIGQLAAKSPR